MKDTKFITKDKAANPADNANRLTSKLDDGTITFSIVNGCSYLHEFRRNNLQCDIMEEKRRTNR